MPKATCHTVHHADWSHAYVLEDGRVILTSRRNAPHLVLDDRAAAEKIVGTSMKPYADRKNRPRDDGWTGDVEFTDDRLNQIVTISAQTYPAMFSDEPDEDPPTPAPPPRRSTRRTR